MAGNKEELFSYLDNKFAAVAFDELTITNERPSNLEWQDIDLTTNISRRIEAPAPILTTPMTTITETQMAIAAAKAGGGGVIHHANTPDEQKDMVRRVKLHLNGVISNPITAKASESVESTLQHLENQGREFRTLPVVDDNGKFIGLITNTHFKLFEGDDITTKISEAMTPAEEVFTAPSSIREDPAKALQLMRERKIKLVPLINDNREVEGLFLLDDVLRRVNENPDKYNLDKDGRLRTFMSVSTYDDDAAERVKHSSKYLDMVVIDTSHGESKYSFSTLKTLKIARKLVKNLREEFAEIDIMVGNVSDGSDESAAVALAREGPDAIRVGRGPGGICISREKLGGGTPQASAIYNIARAVKLVDPEIQICADGGIRGPGDFVKALALGASAVMLGSYVAGTEEAAAPKITRSDGSQYKEYNGMGSAKEQLKSRAARQRYGNNSQDIDLFIEGVEKEIPLQGPVSRKFNELMRGARVEMSTGAFPDIKTMQEEVSFRLVTAAGAKEGQASS